MAAKHWRSGCGEYQRSLSKSAFVHALQRLLPEVCEADLVPGDTGVRAQAIKRDGSLVDDFQIVPSARMLHERPFAGGNRLADDCPHHRGHSEQNLVIAWLVVAPSIVLVSKVLAPGTVCAPGPVWEISPCKGCDV